MMTLMDPNDAIALMVAMNDTSQKVVADSITKEERAKLLKVRAGPKA